MDNKATEFIGKVVTGITKGLTFKATTFEGKTHTLRLQASVDLWQGDVISCYTITDDEGILNIISKVTYDVACDKKSFIYIMVIALGKGTLAGKMLNFYDQLHKLCVDDQTPYDIISDYARSFYNPLNRRDSEALNQLCSFQSKGKPILTQIQAETLLNWWDNFYDYRRVLSLGLTKEVVNKCNISNGELYERLRKNPFTVPQVPIDMCKTVDEIACRDTHILDEYCGGALRYIVRNTESRGYTCTYLSNVQMSYPRIRDNNVLDYFISNFRVFIKTIDVYPDNEGPPASVEVIYFHEQLKIEESLASSIVNRVKEPCYHDKYIEPFFADEQLDSDQRKAVDMALNNNMCLITGPAGSGKTRLLRTLIGNLEMHGIKYVVTSYTGKAVIRAKELNGISDLAATMHRMLFGNFNPGKFEHLIIDESTMVDNWLMWMLLSQFSHKYCITLIGDVNQLSPIAWGSFFQSCIMSRSVPCSRLTSNHRTKTSEGEVNGIIVNTTRITEWPDGKPFLFDKTENFIIINKELGVLKDIIISLKSKGWKARDLTIVSPYRRRSYNGQEYLILDMYNRACQDIWNGDKDNVKVGDRSFFIDDRVMLNKNNYDVDVFNGQEGIVVGFEPEAVLVDFPTIVIRKKRTQTKLVSGDYVNKVEITLVEDYTETEERVTITKVIRVPFAKKGAKKGPYNKNDKDAVTDLDTDMLDHCFAITVHKSQGSEWKGVIFCMPANANLDTGFLQKNLVYVALSRAQDMLVILDINSLTQKAIARKLPYRCECLTSRLMAELPRLYSYVEKKIDPKAFEVAYANDNDDYEGECDDMDYM